MIKDNTIPFSFDDASNILKNLNHTGDLVFPYVNNTVSDFIDSLMHSGYIKKSEIIRDILTITMNETEACVIEKGSLGGYYPRYKLFPLERILTQSIELRKLNFVPSQLLFIVKHSSKNVDTCFAFEIQDTIREYLASSIAYASREPLVATRYSTGKPDGYHH